MRIEVAGGVSGVCEEKDTATATSKGQQSSGAATVDCSSLQVKGAS
jgi:hypothetical protein